MKITDVKTFVVGNPPPGFGGRYFVFIKLITDEGIEGLGEVYNLPYHPSVVEHMVRDVVERCVVGKDPTTPSASGAAYMAAALSTGPTSAPWAS